jgi:hypothetical protein
MIGMPRWRRFGAKEMESCSGMTCKREILVKIETEVGQPAKLDKPIEYDESGEDAPCL